MEHIMIKKSSVINLLKNYDVIVNYVYSEEDIVTKLLISYYRDYIGYINISNMEEVDIICTYDNALACYLNHYEFKTMVRLEYDNYNNYNNEIMTNLINLYNEYNNVLNVVNSKKKWL